MDQTDDPPYTNTPEGRARLAVIRHPLEAQHKQGCDLLVHHQFQVWRDRQGGQTFDIYLVPPPCDCGSRDRQAEQDEAVEALAYALRYPPQDKTNDVVLEMATDIVEKLRRALR